MISQNVETYFMKLLIISCWDALVEIFNIKTLDQDRVKNQDFRALVMARLINMSLFKLLRISQLSRISWLLRWPGGNFQDQDIVKNCVFRALVMLKPVKISSFKWSRIFRPSGPTFWNCQEFLNCWDALVVPVRIESLNQDHIKNW